MGNGNSTKGAPPKVDAFLLCDHVHKDQATGKHSLMGIWDSIQAPEFPAQYGPFGIYFKLRSLNGFYRFGVQCLAPDLQEIVAELQPPAEPFVSRDPSLSCELAFNLPALGLPVPGRYTFRLVYNGQIAEETSILAEQSTQP